MGRTESIRTQYVWIKRGRRRRRRRMSGGGEKGGGWVKGRKDRMKRERRPDQTQGSESEYKKGSKSTRSGDWMKNI